jgi:hypothetical protein
MPQHGDAKPPVGMLEAFDHVVVGRSGGDDETVADAVYALVVVGVDVVHAVGAVVEAVRTDVDAIRKVLLESASAGNVDQLEPAADAEDREIALDRAAGQAELGGVAPLVACAGSRVTVGAVDLGGNVVTADEKQPVEAVEHVVRVVRPVRVGGQHQRLAAGETCVQ